MIMYHSNSTEPYFNMAAEEYLLFHEPEPSVMLWRNKSAVVIGRNQNAYAELNLDFMRENNIYPVRRLTGGGAVFHDLGNINYTFIAPAEGVGVEFTRFCRPIIEALAALGIEASLSGRNDIAITDGRKISGTAACRKITDFGERVLHHGTLLYSADLSRLEGALCVNEEKIKSKGVKSVRSRVVNINTLIPRAMTVEEFKEYLEERLSIEFSARKTSFSPEAVAETEKLVHEKYSTREWIFGIKVNAPQTKTRRFDFGTVTVEFATEVPATLAPEVITALCITGDYFGEGAGEIERLLLGCELKKEVLIERLQKIDVSSCITGINSAQIADLIIN